MAVVCANPSTNEMTTLHCDELMANGDDDVLHISKDNDSLDESMLIRCPVCDELYTEPRVLPCLHVCCTPCIERLLAEKAEENFGGGVVECPVCKQRAPLPDRGNVACLPIDVVMLNARDSLDVRQRQVTCTSCHALQKAVARCADCASFLCPICVNAHQLMHCFKNHKLTSFEDLPNNSSTLVDFHKPMFCSLHTSESLEYFCYSCQVPLCHSCTTCPTHRVHHCERIADVMNDQFRELMSLVGDVKQAKASCEENLATLQTGLETLREQKDAARTHIEQATAAQLSLLEKRQIELLDELTKLHMDAKQSLINKHKMTSITNKQLSEACQFAERVSQNGRGVEIATLKPIVAKRLITLNHTLSQLSSTDDQSTASLEFLPTALEKFDELIRSTLGHFGKPEDDSITEEKAAEPAVAADNLSVSDLISRKLSSLYAARCASMSPDSAGRTVTSAADEVGFLPPRCITASANPVARSSSVTYDDRRQSPFWSGDGTAGSGVGGIGGMRGPSPHIRGQSMVEVDSGQLWSPDDSAWKMNSEFLLSLASKSASRGPTTCFESTDITNQSAGSQLGLGSLNPTHFSGGFGAIGAHHPPSQSTNFFDAPTSHNSSSPTSLSDSGISIDAASTGSGVRSAAVAAATGLGPPADSSLMNLSRLLVQSPVTQPNNTGGMGSWGMSGLDSTLLNHSSSPGLASLLSSGGHAGTDSSTTSLTDSVLSNLLSSFNTNNSSSLTSSEISQLLAGLSSASHTPAIDLLAPRPDLGTARHSELPSTNIDSTLNGILELLAAGNSAGRSLTPSMPNLTLPSHNPPQSISINSNLIRSTKLPQMHLKCKIGEPGVSLGQLSSPHGFCLGVDEDIIVADTLNHRIQIFGKDGEMKNVFGTAGRDDGQLWHPRKVAYSRLTQHYVICDRGNERSRLQVFTAIGQFIRKISIRYIDIVAGLTIDSHGNIVAVDSVKPTVFCITERGELIRWFDCSSVMCEPSDIAVLGSEYFVCDFKGHCIVVFTEDGQYLRHLGDQSVTTFPSGIDTSDAGDILVGDSHGNRFHLAVFQRNGTIISEFECPYVKVSRCCGLRVTAEGYVITLSKNNQHVLVFDTLYIA